MSTLAEYPRPRATSGAIQGMEPCMDMRVTRWYASRYSFFLEIPKSDIFTMPSASTRTKRIPNNNYHFLFYPIMIFNHFFCNEKLLTVSTLYVPMDDTLFVQVLQPR